MLGHAARRRLLRQYQCQLRLLRSRRQFSMTNIRAPTALDITHKRKIIFLDTITATIVRPSTSQPSPTNTPTTHSPTSSSLALRLRRLAAAAGEEEACVRRFVCRCGKDSSKRLPHQPNKHRQLTSLHHHRHQQLCRHRRRSTSRSHFHTTSSASLSSTTRTRRPTAHPPSGRPSSVTRVAATESRPLQSITRTPFRTRETHLRAWTVIQRLPTRNGMLSTTDGRPSSTLPCMLSRMQQRAACQPQLVRKSPSSHPHR